MNSQKDWEEISLKEITTKIGSGVTPRGGSSVYIISGTSLIRSQNIYNGYFDTGGLVFINDETAKKMSNVEIFEDDVLINITGDSVARCTIVPKEILPARINQHVSILRCNKNKIEPRFLKYTLISPYYQSVLLSIATGAGATRNALTKSILEDFKINLPPLETQKKIASILSGYDDLIENNLKRIKILEEMAQQTYDEWFVRMRFPGHDASRASASVNEETSLPEGDALSLPEGWEKVKLGDWIKTSSGGTPSKKKEVEYYKNGSIPWVRTGELKNFILIDSEIKITESGLKNSSAKLFPKGTVLLAMYGNTIGETSYCAFETSTNQACCGFLVEKDYESYFIHQYLLNNKEHILSFRMGAAQENISQSIIQNIELIKPADDILFDFGNGLRLIYDSIINLLNQNQRLREARDILLPRLMMGMIEV